MAKGAEICEYLRPNGGWVMYGNDFEGVEFIEAEPFTKEEFEAAKPLVDAQLAKKAQELADKKAAAEAKLAALGLTADDLKALGLA